MKKILHTILYLVVCCFIFTGCESKEVKRANIDSLVLSASKGNIEDNLKYNNDKYLIESATSLYGKLFDAEDYKSIKNLDRNLIKLCNNNITINELKNTSKINAINNIYLGEDAGKLCRFIDYCYSSYDKDYDYDYCLAGLTTTESIKSFLDKTAIKPITNDGKGGYYDTRKNEYTRDYGKWYDPLSKSYSETGGVGKYRVALDYDFCGDFLIEEKKEVWDGFRGVDNNPNKTYYTTYYKDKITVEGNSKTVYGEFESEPGIDIDSDIYYIESENALISCDSYYKIIYAKQSQTLELYTEK